MPRKAPRTQQERDRMNARRRENRKLKAGRKAARERLLNPGPFKSPAALIATPAAPPALSWVDRAQVAAYGYAGALCPRGI